MSQQLILSCRWVPTRVAPPPEGGEGGGLEITSKADAESLQHSYEKMCEAQLKVLDAQHKTELAKQETLAAKEKLAKMRQTERENVQKERENELLFLEKRQKLLLNVVAEQPTLEQPAPQPAKTLLTIAKEQDYWHTLKKTRAFKILTRVRVWMKERDIMHLPKMVLEINTRGDIGDVYAYDATQHEAIRLMLLEAKAFLEP